MKKNYKVELQITDRLVKHNPMVVELSVIDRGIISSDEIKKDLNSAAKLYINKKKHAMDLSEKFEFNIYWYEWIGYCK